MTSKDLIIRVKSIIKSNQLLDHRQNVVVAVSGGADSLALLHLLAEIDMDLSLTAVYVNHGLRPLEIPFEINVVAQQAKTLGADFRSIAVDVTSHKEELRISLEESARILRYQALQQVCTETNAQSLAIAHTADDQVEEFLLRMLRGSGRQGLATMSFKRDNIIRPFLTTTKNELLTYLKEKNITHCEDSSNRERNYLRNRVRLDLIPFLEQYNPSIQQTIRNISDVLREEDHFLEESSSQFYSRVILTPATTNTTKTVFLDCHRFLAGHKALQRRLLEKIYWQLNCKPSFVQIENLRLFAQNGQNGGTLSLAKGLRVEKQDENLIFNYPFGISTTRQKSPQKPVIDCTVEGLGRYQFLEISRELHIERDDGKKDRESLQNGLIIDGATVQFPLTLRYYYAGETFHPLGSPGTKKISKFLTDKKIHGQNKNFFPVLVDGKKEDKIIALLGLAIDDKHKITDSTTEILHLIWQESEE